MPDFGIQIEAPEIASGEVEAELARILRSQRFLKAESLRNFLRFIVAKTLDRHGDELKESVIAMEAFGRSASFDPRLDSFVRVQAGRLRTALSEYYETEGSDDPVLIEVPKGSYAAVFSRRRILATAARQPTRPWKHAWPVTIAAAVVLLGALWLVHWKRSSTNSADKPVLTEKDTIVVADFENATGDPVFDGTIKQALLMDLEQSPFLKILSDSEVNEIRRLMTRPSKEPLIGDFARELCQRAGARVVLSGSITSMGRLYVIGMTATGCAGGETLVHEQVRAEGKESVLHSLDTAAISLRARLGDTMGNIQRYNVPLDLVTTPSLKALQAYSEGMTARNIEGDLASIPDFQRAIDLDPEFAMAYNRLGILYVDAMQFDLAAQMFRKAYDLRGRVSQRERYFIESRYDHFVAADLNKSLTDYANWRHEFPRDTVPLTGEGMIHNSFGDYAKSASEFQEALAGDSTLSYYYTNLAEAFVCLDRPQDAQSVLDRMQALGMQETDQYIVGYQLAHLRGDSKEMEHQAALAAGSSEGEEYMLMLQAQTAAGTGQLRSARHLIRRAIKLAAGLRIDERAATWMAQGALLDAETGNAAIAVQEADSALRTSVGKNTRALAALALARAGQPKRALALTESLRQEFRDDTVLNRYWLPVIEAAALLAERNPEGAIERLEVARPYELGQPSGFLVLSIAPMFPVYLRGSAFLQAGKGTEAEAQFQIIVQHAGLIQNYPVGFLARIGQARAAALKGDKQKAAGLFNDCLLQWKNADTGLPLLKQIRGEAHKLEIGTE